MTYDEIKNALSQFGPAGLAAIMSTAKGRQLQGGSAVNLGDVGAPITVNASDPAVITLPADSVEGWSGREEITVYQAGAGAVSFAAGDGVTLRGLGASSRYGFIGARRVGPNEWTVIGRAVSNPIEIVGAPYVGNKLTAMIAAGWQNAGGNWTRNGTNISGATALEYTLVSADVPGPVTYKSSNIPFVPAALPVAAAPVVPVAPAITSAPALSGGATVGQPITLTPGAVIGSPTPTSTFSWRDAGGNELSTSASAFTPVAAGSVTVVQTASNGFGSAATRMSNTVTVVAAAAGKWFAATTRNKYPRISAISSGTRGLLSRYPAVIGSGNPKKLRYSFANAYMNSTGEFANQHDVTIHECAIERAATNTAFPVTFNGGSRSAVMPAGAVDFQTDDILPSLFGLTSFPKGETFYIKVKASVVDTNGRFPCSRNVSEVDAFGASSFGGNKCFRWNPDSGVQPQPMETPGAIKNTDNTNPSFSTSVGGFCPVVLGFYEDPAVKTLVFTGDSITEGGPYTYAHWASAQAAQGPYGMVEMAFSAGVPSQYVSAAELPGKGSNASLAHRAYFKYGSVLVDGSGTNDVGEFGSQQIYWAAARAAGVKKIVHTFHTPRSGVKQTYPITNISFSDTTVTVLTPQALPVVGQSFTLSGAGFGLNVPLTPSPGTVTGLVAGGFTYTAAAVPTGTPTDYSAVFWGDLWASEANQNADATSQKAQANHNASLLNFMSQGKIDAVIRFDAIRGSQPWMYKPNYPMLTGDGLHPSAYGAHAPYMGPDAAAVIDAVTVA